MFINNFIYFYIGICFLIIIFEILWEQRMKIRDISIKIKTEKYKSRILEQIENEESTAQTKKEHCRMLRKELRKINNLIAYEKAYNEISEQEDIDIMEYREMIKYTFIRLGYYYLKRKRDMEKAYFAYIIGKKFKNIKNENMLYQFIGILYRLIPNEYIYCRINAMEAIYNIGKTEHIIRAISIINKNGYTYNQNLLANGLKKVEKNKKKLAKELFDGFDNYNKDIQISIIKFLSNFKYIDEDLILEKLKNTNTAVDVRCEIMRYFQKHKNENAKNYLIERLSNEKIVANDLVIKAIGTLGYYKDTEVQELLNELKDSSDDLIKESVHRSLEKRHRLQKQQLLEVV